MKVQRDVTDPMLDVDSKRANCRILSVRVLIETKIRSRRTFKNSYRMKLPGVTNATNRDPYLLGKMNAKLETAHLHCSHLRKAMSSLNWTGLQMCWTSRSCSDRIELDYKLTWKNVPPDGTASRGSRFLSLLMREASSWEPPEGLSPHDSMLKKAYLNLTSTYTIHLARDTGMRRHSYRIGVICSEFHINYMLRESHYNECLTTKNSLQLRNFGFYFLSMVNFYRRSYVTLQPHWHVGRHRIARRTNQDTHGASDHAIRTVIHGNRWHFRSRPTLRICLPSPLRKSTFRSVHGLSHPGIPTTKRLMMEMGPGTLPQCSHLERRTAPAKDRRDLRRSGGGQVLCDIRPSVWVLTSGGGRAYSGKGSLFCPARDIQYQFSVMPFELCNAPRKF
ncbi:hypothetical protein T01_11965 [Trichinella spiralis]|uniref:Uncharacterized protein n=1 Tax=Trichinella spiralis TaxID=6334 RepID=A0A0V1BHR6_TRISP|nr:hypothetical protein T01_11965 [Trichinella spiralis]